MASANFLHCALLSCLLPLRKPSHKTFPVHTRLLRAKRPSTWAPLLSSPRLPQRKARALRKRMVRSPKRLNPKRRTTLRFCTQDVRKGTRLPQVPRQRMWRLWRTAARAKSELYDRLFPSTTCSTDTSTRTPSCFTILISSGRLLCFFPLSRA